MGISSNTGQKRCLARKEFTLNILGERKMEGKNDQKRKEGRKEEKDEEGFY